MAIAVATCTCRRCGAKFERRRKCLNRKEADSWEDWASKTFDLCPKCYGEEQREAEAKEPLSLHFRLVPQMAKFCLVWQGGVFAHKDEIKALGYFFREPVTPVERPSQDIMKEILHPLSVKAWTKEVPFSELKKELDAARSLGAVIINHTKRNDQICFRKMCKLNAACDKMIAEIPKPEKPACYPKGKWNGKVYGSSKYGYNIYVDGVKTSISEQDKALLEKYNAEIDDYVHRVGDVKKQKDKANNCYNATYTIGDSMT